MDNDDHRNDPADAAVVALNPPEDLLAEQRNARALAGKVCAAAAIAAQASARMLELLGELDAIEGFRHYDGCGSTARWLAWSCSMSQGTAREHVRIARALRRMPELGALFRDGRLSYSKVRAATRLVGVVEEAGLCELALTMTAAQLDQTVSAYRASSGSRIGQQERRQVSWTGWSYGSTGVDADHAGDDADGVEAQMVCITARLPVEEAAVVIAAIECARDRQPFEERDTADALVDVAREFLAAGPVDESGEDRTMVVVQVGAEALLDGTIAGTSGTTAGASETVVGEGYGHHAPTMQAPTPDAGMPDCDDLSDVPAGTSDSGPVEASDRGWVGAPGEVQAGLRAGVCTIPGVGPLEPATAAKLACDATILGAIVDRDGAVLALGRARRLVSKTQRRALMERDRMCRFPGCHRDRHLQAHHVVAWSRGGRTDLDNLILVCQRHHTYLHEGGVRPERVPHGWRFLLPDGRDVSDVLAWRCGGDDGLARHLADHARHAERVLAGVTGPDDEAARPLRPGWAGEPFSLHNCVEALFGLADLQRRAERSAAA